MLVMTRRIGEEVVIGGTVRVKVMAVLNRRVRLGIDAPQSVAVDREEVRARRNVIRRASSSGTVSITDSNESHDV